MIGSIRVDLHTKLPLVQKKSIITNLRQVLVYLAVQKHVVLFIVSPEVKNHKAGKNIYPRLKACNPLIH